MDCRRIFDAVNRANLFSIYQAKIMSKHYKQVLQKSQTEIFEADLLFLEYEKIAP